MLEATAMRSQQLPKWNSGADRRIRRLFGYLGGTFESCLVSQSVDGTRPEDLFLDGHSDSGHGTCPDTRRSISSGDVAVLAGDYADEKLNTLTGADELDVFIPAGHLVRRQGAVPRSSTEAEIGAGNDVVTKLALPLLGVPPISATTGRS